MALNNLNAIKDYEETNIQYVQYSGPTGTLRNFCKEHIGKIYSIEEAKKLKNDFGQSAFVWVGGYNCRHRWDAVTDSPIFKDKSGGKVFINKNFVETEGKEISIAKLRAKAGINIQLKNKIDNIKSADAFENGIKTEYKRIGEKAVNLQSAVQRSLRAAKEQAGNIVVWIDRYNYDEVKMKKGIKLALDFDINKKIRKFTVIKKDGEEIK